MITMKEGSKIYVTSDKKVFPYLSQAVNHERFTLDRICETCRKELKRGSNFCICCGGKAVAPTPCPGHKPGNMGKQGFHIQEWMVPSCCPTASDIDAWGSQCTKCGYVAYDEPSKKED